ncbi:hypothetical protein PRIPAC_79339 [Pristionchus pacificus]|uniref:glucuronosyltransferase n=1 Tax=Pristionchus pacificus TaxID=54126 RepID=A0A2A6CLS1_PRIPA|nr:hypothetical protein PRIPAC_79339 [Pristionchus pacificus]|eukprot:PDM79195.1 Glycosyltransferase [Pristionchus pacificus]
MKLILLLLALVLCIHNIDSYKILVYNSVYDHSHSQFLGNIADILVEAGHDVTSLIPIIDPRFNHGTEKSKKIVIEQSDETKKIMIGFGAIRASYFMNNILDPSGVYHYRWLLASHFISQCRAVLNETQLLESLRLEKFDVMIVMNFDMCGVALSHLLKPRSLINSVNAYPNSYMFEEFGIPLALSHNPSSFIPDHDVHSMWSRIRNIYANIMVHFHFYPRRILEISSHAAYTLTNSEPLIDYATPTLNRISWNTVLAQRSKAILISFGSKVRGVDLPPAFKLSIATVIDRFPDITFIWKYEEPEDAFAKETSTSLPNVHFSAWLPQNDLLNDNRVFAFVTHGGIGSSIELALRGKPGIFVPIFGDQPRNAGMMEHNCLGKVLDKFDLADPDKVEAVIREVLTDKRYADNSRKTSAMLAKKPYTPQELLIKIVEFAAEFGPSKALRSQSYDMSAVEYHNLDILAVATIFLVLLALSTMLIVKRILRRLIDATSINEKNKTE